MGKATTILLVLIVLAFGIYYFSPEQIKNKDEKSTVWKGEQLKTFGGVGSVTIKYVSRSGSKITGIVYLDGERVGKLKNGAIDISFSAIPEKKGDDPFIKPNVKIELKGFSGGNPIHLKSFFPREDLYVGEIEVEAP
jgi:hypothetical protein